MNLAVSSLAVRASAESKAMDNQGLEAGLSYIGLLLDIAERQIAELMNRRVQLQRPSVTVMTADGL